MNEYKIIPWEEVAINQEFEDAEHHEAFNTNSFTKISESTFKAHQSSHIYIDFDFPEGCLVRIADCEPELPNAEDRIKELERKLNPRLWTEAEHQAWHRAIPNMQKAFDDLKEAISTQ